VEVYARVGVSMGTSLGTARAYLGFIDDGLAYNEANWPGARAAASPVVIGIIGHEVGTILALARDPRRARMWSEQALAEFLKLPSTKRNTFIELIIRRPLALACLFMGDVASAEHAHA